MNASEFRSAALAAIRRSEQRDLDARIDTLAAEAEELVKDLRGGGIAPTREVNMTKPTMAEAPRVETADHYVRRVEELAKGLMKADRSLTLAGAEARVLETPEGADLYAKYRAAPPAPAPVEKAQPLSPRQAARQSVADGIVAKARQRFPQAPTKEEAVAGYLGTAEGKAEYERYAALAG